MTLATGLSLLAAVLFFIISGRIINGVAPEDGLQRTALTAVVFGVTEAIRTTIFSQTMVMSGAAVDILLPHRLLGGSMTGMLVIGIVSLLSADRDRYYADYERLIARQGQLTRELEALNHTISRFIDDLTTSVREVVDTALASSNSRKRATSTKDVVDHIVNVSENVVRPLSQEVVAALPQVDEDGEDQPRVSPKRVFDLMTVVAPFQPLGMPLVIFMLFFSAALFLVPRETGLLLIALSVGGVWLSHLIGARVLHKRLPTWPIFWRIIVTTGVYSAGFFVSLGAIIVARGYGTTIDRLGTLIYVVVIVSAVSWGLALIPAIREGQREIIADMDAATAALMQVRARNEVRLRRDKQRLSSIIHGDIQAILMATALKLQKDNYTGDALNNVITQTREAIDTSLKRADESLPRKTLDLVTRTLTEFWEGIVAVSWDIAPGCHGVVDGDDDLPEMLFQVLREAITNSAKHGRASIVHVHLSIDSDNHIVCRVSDNGDSVPGTRRPGAGTQFFEAVADRVTFDRVGEETVLVLIIPLPTSVQAVSVG
jgi:signal transduction histidine kinase